MLTIRAVGSLLTLLCLLPLGLAGQVPDDLRQAMDQRDEAIVQANAIVWDRLTTEDFTVVRENGRLMTKAERLAQLRQQTPAPLPAPEQEQIQRYGDVVVRRIRVGDVWVLQVWVRGEQGWRVSIGQLTRVAQ